YPPIVNIPADEMFTQPKEAYASALKQHGPIIGVWRKGRLEYIVNEQYTNDILNKDHEFSFERGVATILNLSFLVPFIGGNFFKDMHMMVSGGIIPRMDQTIEQIFPIFKRQAKILVEDAQRSQTGVDLFGHARRCIAEAMLVVSFGECYVNEHNIKVAEEVADAVATLTGIYQNTSYFARTFPRTWKIITWVKVVSEVIVFKYFPMVLPIIWKEVRSRKYRPLRLVPTILQETLLHYAARVCANTQGTVSFLSTIWLSVVMLTFIFASVHQTASVAVWIMYELAMRRKYIPAIQEELSIVADSIDNDGVQRLSYEALRRATVLDSFIREVLRLKGDTLGVVRGTTGDIPLGGYVIPKDTLVYPLSTLTHESRAIYGDDATTFDPQRWEEGPAASTVTSGYLAFGSGRWACPGRVLAVAEIKMIVMTLIATSMPVMEGGKYIVVDPLNVTSVPPEGRLVLHPWNETSNRG
ncbi:cytochrome P450, partial [Scleroderma citrinum]